MEITHIQNDYHKVMYINEKETHINSIHLKNIT